MYINLRHLEEKDAIYMLEWMHDRTVVEKLKTDFSSKTLQDCLDFIYRSNDDDCNMHMAIVDEDDIYQGTVSLKNICDNTAEFAITIRNFAMGRGIAKIAMEQIVRKGFIDKSLELIYWYVSPENKRAIRFYDKNKYNRISPKILCNMNDKLRFQGVDIYTWYAITKDEWSKRSVIQYEN